MPASRWGRIFCVGRNYHAHAIEMAPSGDAQPFIIRRRSLELGASPPYPPGTRDYQHEMEPVVAIGAGGFRVAEADAPSSCGATPVAPT